MPNTTYNILITATAEKQLDYIIYYVLTEYADDFAARAIYEDANETYRALAYMAGSIKISDDPDLAQYNYRIIKFRKHKYVMAYRLEGNTAIVDGIYHSSQNYAEDLVLRIKNT